MQPYGQPVPGGKFFCCVLCFFQSYSLPLGFSPFIIKSFVFKVQAKNKFQSEFRLGNFARMYFALSCNLDFDFLGRYNKGIKRKEGGEYNGERKGVVREMVKEERGSEGKSPQKDD
jgi:hypothetical protein